MQVWWLDERRGLISEPAAVAAADIARSYAADRLVRLVAVRVRTRLLLTQLCLTRAKRLVKLGVVGTGSQCAWLGSSTVHAFLLSGPSWNLDFHGSVGWCEMLHPALSSIVMWSIGACLTNTVRTTCCFRR